MANEPDENPNKPQPGAVNVSSYQRMDFRVKALELAVASYGTANMMSETQNGNIIKRAQVFEDYIAGG